MKQRWTANLLLIFPAILCVFVFLPLLLLLSGSLTHSTELTQLLAPMLRGGEGFAEWEFVPRFPTLQQYVELLLDRPQFFVMFWNSVYLVAGSLLLQLIFATPAAWWFARNKRTWGKRLFLVYIILMLMPFQVTMVSNYLMLKATGMLNTHWSILVPAAFSPFPVFIMYRFFRAIPDSVLEAAKIDGANDLRVFIHIGAPVGSAGVASAMILSFMEYWNLIEQPMTFLEDQSLWPLSLYLPEISLDMAGVAMAASVLTLLPSLLIFLYGQSYLEQGILASALKE